MKPKEAKRTPIERCGDSFRICVRDVNVQKVEDKIGVLKNWMRGTIKRFVPKTLVDAEEMWSRARTDKDKQVVTLFIMGFEEKFPPQKWIEKILKSLKVFSREQAIYMFDKTQSSGGIAHEMATWLVAYFTPKKHIF